VLSDSEVVLDREELRNMTLGDPQLMTEILWALIDDATRHAGAIDAAARDHDTARTSRIARYAARACANVGAASAAEAFLHVERHAGRRDFGACRAALTQVRAAIERLREEATEVA
jgi:HPt (histidine-containing phosphotransfer) domain-containing protein